MAHNSDRKSFLVIISVLSVVISLTFLISVLARGYQPDFNDGFKFKATGLLSATSKPKSASVFINNRLYTATDDTINLAPGEYQVKIVKDGYFPWSKAVSIKKEMVYQTEAILFRSAPDFKPLTQNGALNLAVSPDKSNLIFSVASASSTKDNGIYLIETYSAPLPLGKNTPKLIVTNLPNIDWSNFSFTFSPNSKQILAISHTKNNAYLLNLDQISNQKTFPDVFNLISSIKNDWQKQKSLAIASKLDRLPADLRPNVATISADILFSEDDTKALYSTGSQYFVYDFTDKHSFPVGDLSEIQNPFWLSNSNNIVFTDKNQQVKTIEYDGTNLLTIFAGIFLENVIVPWSDGSKLIIYTSPFPQAQENLYSVSIR